MSQLCESDHSQFAGFDIVLQVYKMLTPGKMVEGDMGPLNIVWTKILKLKKKV